MSVNPGLVKLRKLVEATVTLLQGYSPQKTLHEQCETHGIQHHLRQLKVSQMQLHVGNPGKGMGIRNIFDLKNLRVSVYHLQSQVTMKLHNHPQMAVITYVLQGTMHASLYTPLEKQHYRKRKTVMKAGDMSLIDGLRTEEDNLHEFTAKEQTYFLDIIWPDYSYQKPCLFYTEVSTQEGGLVELKNEPKYQPDFYIF